MEDFVFTDPQFIATSCSCNFLKHKVENKLSVDRREGKVCQCSKGHTRPQYTISPEAFFIFLSWETKYQKRDLATMWLGAKILIRYRGGAGFLAEGNRRPITLYSRSCVQKTFNQDTQSCIANLREHLLTPEFTFRDTKVTERRQGPNFC